VEDAAVEPRAAPDFERMQPVDVVPDDDDPGDHGVAVDREADLAASEHEPQRSAEAAPGAVLIGDERRVEPEGGGVQEDTAVAEPTDVDAPLFTVEGAQGAERVVAVDPGVPGEVVERAVGNADEREVALERGRGDRRERAMPNTVAPPAARAIPCGSSPSRSTCVSIPRASAASTSSAAEGRPAPARGLTSKKADMARER